MATSTGSSGFDIQQLRLDIKLGRRRLRITTHAQVEAFKDGLLLADLRDVFEYGEVIELYSKERRALLFAHLEEYDLPVHIVVEETADEGVIVTAYVPDHSLWLEDRRRKRGKL
jgi:hypothetical protein